MELLLAAMAILVSALTAALAWRQNNRLSDRVAMIEEARRRDELRPDLRARWHLVDSDPAIALEHHGPLPLVRVEWSFAPDQEVHPIKALDGGTHGTIGPLDVGKSRTILAEMWPQGAVAGTVMIRCRCFTFDDDWTVVVEARAERPRPIGAY